MDDINTVESVIVEKQAVSDHSLVCITTTKEKKLQSFLKLNISAKTTIPNRVWWMKWLCNRSAYCEVNKVNKANSEIFYLNYRTIQGAILGLLLFALFISPLAVIATPTTYADDNSLAVKTEKEAVENCLKDTELTKKWFLNSGLCVNKKKTKE